MSSLLSMMPQQNPEVFEEEMDHILTSGDGPQKSSSQTKDRWDGHLAGDWDEQHMADATQLPFILRAADGSKQKAMPRGEAVKLLTERMGENAEEVLSFAREAAKAALKRHTDASGADLSPNDRRDFVANVEGALLAAHLQSASGEKVTPEPATDVDLGGVRLGAVLGEAWQSASSKAAPVSGQKADTEMAPQAPAAVAADIPEGEQEIRKEKTDSESVPQKTAGPQRLFGKAPEKPGLHKASYVVKMPQLDGQEVMAAEEVPATMKRLPQELGGRLRELRRLFVSQVMANAFQTIDLEGADEADMKRLSTTIGNAYLATQIARASLGHDETSPVRATIEGMPALDTLFAEGLARETMIGAEHERLADPFGNAVPDIPTSTSKEGGIPLSASDPVDVAEDTVMGPARAGMAMVMNGDPEPELPVEKELTVQQRMEAIGFPARPRIWPGVMSWPMQPDFDMLTGKNVSDKDRRAYIEGLEQMQKDMIARAEQIHEYIMTTNNPADRRRSKLRQSLKYVTFGAGAFRENDRRDRSMLKHMDRTQDDPFYGIRWASLLDEKSTRPAANIVREWSHHRAVTNDGGEVLVHRDNISFRNITQQAVALSIQEGVARGWGSFNMQGDAQFALAAIQAAKQANVKAEIMEFYGPWNMFKRRHTIMPVPPGVAREEARVETETLGPEPNDSNVRKPLDEEAAKSMAGESGRMTTQDRQASVNRLAKLGAKSEAGEPDADRPDASTEVIEETSQGGITWSEDASAPQPDTPSGPRMS